LNNRELFLSSALLVRDDFVAYVAILRPQISRSFEVTFAHQALSKITREFVQDTDG
jgi:hypothetical protein